MEMEKKNVALIILVVALVASGVGNIILALLGGEIETPPTYETLIVGTGEGPVVLDPIDSWDSASNDVIMQVAETLFWYDLRDPNLPLEPLLVKDEPGSFSFSPDGKDLYLELREDVWFHNYDRMDADAVIWNIERWMYFTNSTGALPSTEVPAFPSSLYYLPNGTAMFAGVTKEGDFNLTIHLNGAFGPFLSFLSYTSNSIIAPLDEYETSYIPVTTGDLIGTGPFTFDSYRTDVEVRFSRWGGYWRGGAYFEKLVFDIVEDSTTRNQALLAGDIDILFGALPDLLTEFESSPDTVVVPFGKDLIYWYMAFNTVDVNVTWRKALAYAYNYSYVVDVIRLGNAERGCPAVPEGMPGHNATTQAILPGEVGTFGDNVAIARGYMQSMGFGTGWDTTYPGTNEAEWTGASFRTFEINAHQGSTTNEKLNTLAEDNFELIGVDISVTVRDWDEFLETGEQRPEEMELWYVGWGPDYLDAFNMLDPLFNNASASNFIQLNDPQVQDLLAQAGEETDENTRLDLYKRLQHIIFIKLVAHMPLWATLQRYVHATDIKNYPYNTMANFYAWPMYREA